MKKENIPKPKGYLTTKIWQESVTIISVAVGDGMYKDIMQARGVILDDFSNAESRIRDYDMKSEIECDECIEIPVYDAHPPRRYMFSYLITKVY